MELSQKYILKINNTKNFSKAAKELYISQPSLSLTVKKVESELGFLIFDRTKIPVGITEKGKVYIEYLEDMLRSEKEMQRKIERLSMKKNEKLTVGAPNFFAREIMPIACGEFHKRHPETEVIVDLCETAQSEASWKKLENGKIDLLYRNYYNKSKFSGEYICNSIYVIAMRKDYPGAEKLIDYALTREEILSLKNIDEVAIKDYSLFKNIGFVRYAQGGSVWSHMYELFEHCRFSPSSVINSLSFGAHYDMMLNGNGAVVTSRFLISRRPEKSNEILYFPTDVQRSIMAVYRKGESLSEHAREFIDITKEIVSRMQGI